MALCDLTEDCAYQQLPLSAASRCPAWSPVPWSRVTTLVKPSPSATSPPAGDAMSSLSLEMRLSVGSCAWSGRPCRHEKLLELSRCMHLLGRHCFSHSLRISLVQPSKFPAVCLGE